MFNILDVQVQPCKLDHICLLTFDFVFRCSSEVDAVAGTLSF